MSDDSSYSLGGEGSIKQIHAPDFDFNPPMPNSCNPNIGLIGCGGITDFHLKAYREMGINVVALCDLDGARMEKQRDQFYPEAELFSNYNDLLKRNDIDVVDIALHPEPRFHAIKAALQADKHVLSQKPFVLDLDRGLELVELADSRDRKLAVNQNGRWAPYVRYATQAIGAGLLGDIQSLSIRMNWDHTWVKGTPFETIQHLILYDFAIHWVDMVRLFMGDRKALSAFASIARTRDQAIGVPMMASISLSFENALANLIFDGHSRIGPCEDITIVGSAGTIRCTGEVCKAHDVTMTTKEGSCRPVFQGEWFHSGFQGTMGELLCSIEENREPENSARNNLESLKLAFAAIASADSGQPVIPGTARELGDTCKPVSPNPTS